MMSISLAVISPPGIAMSAGLCFPCDFLFLNVAYTSFDNGLTDRNADCGVNTVDEKKILRLQI